MFLLKKKFSFDAAHRLPLPSDHKCSKLHGHTYELIITLKGMPNETGMVMDYSDIKSTVSPLVEELDHSFLNDIPGLENPTSENIALWIWRKIKPQLPLLYEVAINETPSTSCVYREGL